MRVGALRVLIASRVFPPDTQSGVATVMRNLHQRMREEADVRLVAGAWRDASLLPSAARTVDLSGDRGLRGQAAFEFAVRRTALTFRPHVVIAHGVEVPVDLAPTVGILTHPGDRSGGRLSGLKRRLALRRVGNMAVPVVPTETARLRWIDFGVPADRLRVAYPGVDTADYSPTDDKEERSDDRLRLLYAARIRPDKGQHIAVEAIAGLHPQVRDRVVLDIVGPVEDADYLQSLHRRARGAPVEFHDVAPDLALFYRSADIVLFPTTGDEVFGYSAVDGMACGKPVVFSRLPALLEVTDGIGLAVPPGDVKRFGEAVRKLVKDPELRADLGRRGRQRVVETFGWDQAWSRYWELIEEAAGR